MKPTILQLLAPVPLAVALLGCAKGNPCPDTHPLYCANHVKCCPIGFPYDCRTSCYASAASAAQRCGGSTDVCSLGEMTGGGLGECDGVWGGTYTGSFRYAGGSTIDQNGMMTFTVMGDAISMSQPGDGPGTITADHTASFRVTRAGMTPYAFEGTFNCAQRSAQGTYTLTITNSSTQNGMGSGNWTATRSFP